MVRSCVLLVVTLAAAAPWTSAQTNGAALLPGRCMGGSTADLLVEDLIPTNNGPVTITGDTGLLEVFTVRVKPKKDRVLANVLLRFRSRDIQAAQLTITLMDDAGNILGQARHVEKVGPVETQIRYAKRHSLPRAWNDPRSVWIEFPQEAAVATVVALEVWHLP